MATSRQLIQQGKMNDKKVSRLQKELKEALAKKKAITTSLVKAKAEEKLAAAAKKAKAIAGKMKAAGKSKAKSKAKKKGSARRKR